MKLYFNKNYFILSILLFTIEALIAVFLKDGFIRHTFGDFLVVILLYCIFSSFVNTKPIIIALAVLAIAFTIEFLQFINLIDLLNLQNNKLSILILGNTFHIGDLVAYTFGIIFVLIAEKAVK